jgi:hypothetical protein
MDTVNVLFPIMPEFLPWKSWTIYMKHLFDNSPILRDFWRDSNSWFPESLQHLIASFEANKPSSRGSGPSGKPAHT